MVQGLSASELLEVWERGTTLTEVDRALLLLSWRLHGKSSNELALIPLDERDCMLVELRSATFGSRLEAFSNCVDCGEALESSLDAGSLCPSSVASIAQDTWVGYRMRLPNTADMRAAAACANPREAAAAIFQRCVMRSLTGQDSCAEIAGPDVTDTMLTTYSAWIAEQAPATEILLDMECPACGRRSSITFDIVSFFWREIEAAVGRLVREVDALARMYGWSETQILSMSSARRGLYLEAVSA